MPAQEPTRHTWTSFGLELVYHAWDPPADAPTPVETVVLLHGFLDHGRAFGPVAEILARRFRVVAPDHRGHGESGHVGAGGYYHFPDYLHDLHRLFEQLDLQTALLAGHSMGASVACYFAGAFSERVKALALLDGIGPAHVPADRSPAIVRRWVNDVRLTEARHQGPSDAPSDVMASLEEVARRIARTSPGATQERLMTLAETASVKLADGTYRWRFDKLHRTTSPMPFDVHRFRAFLQAIRCPTLSLWGERSPMRPPDANERLALIPDTTHQVLPGAAHNLHHERPAELAQVLLDFFERVR